MKLLLFDIDGTLIHSDGAGMRAMTAAFEQLYGIADAFKGVSMAGRTDTSILIDAFINYQLPFTTDDITNFKNRYAELLPIELRKANKQRIMPGVNQLLEALKKRNNIYIGLLTGNWEVSGRIKLHHFGLNDYFHFGAFADDSPQRDQLLPFAWQRCQARYGCEVKREDIFIIGDTPHDILCAKPHGVRSVAVAAASHSLDDLRPFAPDYLLTDLSDTAAVLQIFI